MYVKLDNYARWSIRIKSHWTPKYLINRIKEYSYRKKFPDKPWLNQDAIKTLENLVLPADCVLEFGSGRSTIWFANKCNSIISFEDDALWYDSVKEKLTTLPAQVDYKLIEIKHPLYLEEFRKAIQNLENASIDLCLVDGCPRGLCAFESLPKIKSGGVLVIDNVNWFLPGNTISPSSVKTDEEIPAEFVKLYNVIKHWRFIWTSNGVTDTAFYIKP